MIHTSNQALPHGIHLSCRHSVPADDLSRVGDQQARVLLLHGFPEAAFIWDEVMCKLGDDVCCLAPNLRGYEHSSAPAEVQAYRAKALVQDVDALIHQTWGGTVDLLVAHDWGGALAWALAARKPQSLKRLLIINSPHPGAFWRDMAQSPTQRAASAYMDFLCRPDAAARLREDQDARLWSFFTRMGGERWLTEPLRAQYRAVWDCGLEGALNYYRASPMRPGLIPAAAKAEPPWSDEDVTVRVPTTMLWAQDDVALPRGLTQGLSAWVPDLRLIEVPGATHWVVHEQPDLVVQTMREALAR